jgi:hypothetical protein
MYFSTEGLITYDDHTQKQMTLTNICCTDICRNARFVLDRPLLLHPDDLLEMDAGLFYLHRDGQVRLLGGMWEA